jgi:NTP pyrophosphatase (non-canonical NTP hydrolase)
MGDLKTLQDRIAKTRAELGFNNDPLQLQVLLVEEVGEVSKELRQLWASETRQLDSEALANELADVFIYLTSIASSFEIDLGEAVERKFFGQVVARYSK